MPPYTVAPFTLQPPNLTHLLGGPRRQRKRPHETELFRLADDGRNGTLRRNVRSDAPSDGARTVRGGLLRAGAATCDAFGVFQVHDAGGLAACLVLLGMRVPAETIFGVSKTFAYPFTTQFLDWQCRLSPTTGDAFGVFLVNDAGGLAGCFVRLGMTVPARKIQGFI